MDDGTHHLSLLPQHNDAALAAWLPKWWNQGRAWQQPPAEPENPEEPYHGQDEEDRHLLGQPQSEHPQLLPNLEPLGHGDA
ncbi:hypothetical protein WJX84_007841 [Apatococcus fuscideae]|uniref:Uncharacterized protein n=1 Tax=Apatococcus fuscideae TaxID=2026836 RepID=A0AAW1SU88_9CHLO